MVERPPDRILVVENDPVIGDLISRQALEAAGYQTMLVEETSTAISQAARFNPDAVIVDIDLPGLSGKDLMVALAAQGIDAPVIVVAQKGSDVDIVQSFRLGAADFLLWPVREAEVINVLERVLKQVYARRERQELSRQLQLANRELKQRVKELTTIYGIGKAVTSIIDQSLLFDRILEGAARVTQADLGWFLLREDEKKSFVLVAQRNLPPSLSGYIQQAWDDGLSSLVAMSGETLAIDGEAVKRFKVGSLGKAALVVPVKSHRDVVGLLVVMRKQALPFSTGEQNLLEAVADYASISLVNALLFRTLEERAQSFKSKAENTEEEMLDDYRKSLQAPFLAAMEALTRFDDIPRGGRLDRGQQRGLQDLQKNMQELRGLLVSVEQLPAVEQGVR